MKRAKDSIFTQEARLTYWQTRPHICGLCGKPIGIYSDMHLDHIIPVSKGGETSPENIQLTHKACNLRKGDRIPPTALRTPEAEGFASCDGWIPICYSEKVGWYGLAVASLRGAIGLMKDAGNYDFIVAYFQGLKNGSEYAWPYFTEKAKQFAARYFDHEVDIEKVISIYREKIAPYFFLAASDIEQNCAIKYLEGSPHRVLVYDIDSDGRPMP